MKKKSLPRCEVNCELIAAPRQASEAERCQGVLVVDVMLRKSYPSQSQAVMHSWLVDHPFC